MTGQELLQARQSRNWEQSAAAVRLSVSQSYLSLLETGKRRITQPIARRAVRVFNLSPAVLPIQKSLATVSSVTENVLAGDIAALGYPKFSHLRKKRRKKNPAEVLLHALRSENLDSRLTESLPWLILEFSDLNWAKTIKTAKIYDLQNRLGFLISVARRLAHKTGDNHKTEILRKAEIEIARSRLYREDTLCHSSLGTAEKTWLKQNRSRDARFWRLLTDLKPENLSYGK